MRPYPNLFTFAGLRAATQSGASQSRDGKVWHPARPIGWCSLGNRVRCAWLVFHGKADALVWPGDEADVLPVQQALSGGQRPKADGANPNPQPNPTVG